jgi:transposase
VVPSTERTPEIVALYEAGRSCREIGEAVGVSGHAVSNALRLAGVKRRKGGGRKGVTKVPLERLRELTAQGLTLTELAFETGLDMGGLSRRLRRNGIPTPGQWSAHNTAEVRREA